MTRKESGQSLIEVLAALAVVILVVLALVMVVTTSIRNATFAKNQSLATKYAQEAIEKVRAFRDEDPDSFFAGSCLSPEDLSGFGFDQTIDCLIEGEDKVKVTVAVSWTDAKGEHQSALSTYLTKW